MWSKWCYKTIYTLQFFALTECHITPVDHGRLHHVGLRFEDIIDNEQPIVQAAVARMSEEEKLARDARIRRAMDISAKKSALPADMQAAHDVTANDMFKHLEVIIAEDAERAPLMGKATY